MALNCNEDQPSALTHDDDSEDKIFSGPKLTIEDMIKRLFPDNCHQTVECVVNTLEDGPGGSKYASFQNKEIHILSSTIPKHVQSSSLTPDSKVLSNWDLEAEDLHLKKPETNPQLQDITNTVHDNEKASSLQEEALDFITLLNNNDTYSQCVVNTLEDGPGGSKYASFQNKEIHILSSTIPKHVQSSSLTPASKVLSNWDLEAEDLHLKKPETNPQLQDLTNTVHDNEKASSLQEEALDFITLLNNNDTYSQCVVNTLEDGPGGSKYASFQNKEIHILSSTIPKHVQSSSLTPDSKVLSNWDLEAEDLHLKKPETNPQLQDITKTVHDNEKASSLQEEALDFITLLNNNDTYSQCVVNTLEDGPGGSKYASFQNKEIHILSSTIPKHVQSSSLTPDSKVLSNWDLEAENLHLKKPETNPQLQDITITVHDNEKASSLQEEALDFITPLNNNDTYTVADPQTPNIVYNIFTTASELKTRSLSRVPGNLTHKMKPTQKYQHSQCVVNTLEGGPGGSKYASFQNKEIHILSSTIPKHVQSSSLTPDSKVLSNWDLEAEDLHLKKPETNTQLQDITNTVHDNEKASSLQEEALDFITPLNNNDTYTVAGPKTPNIVYNIFTTASELKTRSLSRVPGKLTHKMKPTQKYKHVISPVAAYIKQTPQVPLLQNVCPKKTLPGVSHTPKSVKYLELNKENMKKGIQENFKLPAVAYKSAKKTKMINIPDERKMPQSQWAKEVASSIPKATVIKHNHREVNSVNKPLLQKQENSFADLSLHQADLSVCTQKSALKKLK